MQAANLIQPRTLDLGDFFHMQPQASCSPLCHDITCYPVSGPLRERCRRERPFARHAQRPETVTEQINTAQTAQYTRLSQANIGSEQVMNEQDLTLRLIW